MVLGIVLPDGVGIKNYLYAEFPSLFLSNENNKIVLFHSPLDNDLLQEIAAPFGDKMTLVELPVYYEDLKSRIIREAITFARLKYFGKKLNNLTIINAAPVANNWKRKLILGAASIIGSILSQNYSSILSWEKKYSKRLETIDIDQQLTLLHDQGIDVIFSLHQRPLENIPIYEAARRLNLRRCTVIYSWDNVAKARLYSPSEKYFLWSKYMLDQMKLFYPEISENKLVITGTPQFSFYFNSAYQTNKSTFYQQWNLDETKPIILFSGSDLRT